MVYPERLCTRIVSWNDLIKRVFFLFCLKLIKTGFTTRFTSSLSDRVDHTDYTAASVSCRLSHCTVDRLNPGKTIQASLDSLTHTGTRGRFFNQTQPGPSIKEQEQNGVGITQISQCHWLICSVIHRPAAAAAAADCMSPVLTRYPKLNLDIRKVNVWLCLYHFTYRGGYYVLNLWFMLI